MSNSFSAPVDDPRDALERAVEALADLSALQRGGGRPGLDPKELARAFAEAMAEALRGESVELEVRPSGLYQGGQPFWAQQLMARRVGAALHGQGLASIALPQGAPASALAELAHALARDWTEEEPESLARASRAGLLTGFSWEFRQARQDGRAALRPAALLQELRAGRSRHSEELARDLVALRAVMVGQADTAHAVRGIGEAARQRLQPELLAIATGQDVDFELIGRILFECLRLEHSHLQVVDTFRLGLTWFESLIGLRRPADAFDLMHRALSLVDPAVAPEWPHREVYRVEVRASFGEPALRRLVQAANAAPEADWAPLLFLVSGLSAPERAAGLVEPCAELQAPAHRQAVADGLLRCLGADTARFEALLGSAQGDGLAIVLLAVGRLDAPALLERILARMESPSPFVRQAALVALRRHRSPRTQQRVRAALQDPALPVRVEALRYLTVYREVEIAPQLLERLRTASELEEEEARALGIAFAMLARQEAVLPLARLAQEAAARRPVIATSAIRALLSLGEGGRAAVQGLSRGSPELRRLVRQAGGPE